MLLSRSVSPPVTSKFSGKSSDGGHAQSGRHCSGV